MKHLLHTALFTGCLCASLFCHAQFSETLLDENFDDGQFDAKELSIRQMDRLQIASTTGISGNHLEIVVLPYQNFLHGYPNDLVFQNDKTLEYDSLEATFVFDPNLGQGPFSVFHKGNGNYQLIAPSGQILYYKDSLGKEFTKYVPIISFLEIWPGDGKWIQYNPDTKVLRMKWGKQSTYNLLSHFIRTEFQNTDCPNTLDFFILWDCFCNTTSNPKDCRQKLFPQPSPPINYAIDNLVIKGFNKTVTGFGHPTELSLKEKYIIKSVDLMGREIPDLANYKGPAIVLFSDGSREKQLY